MTDREIIGTTAQGAPLYKEKFDWDPYLVISAVMFIPTVLSIFYCICIINDDTRWWENIN